MALTVTWHQGPVPPHLPVRQVYGLLFDRAGRILALYDGRKYTLPGGKPEAGETLLDTLARECMEECQVEIADPVYIGYIHVSDDEAFAQVRFAGLTGTVHAPAPDPATGVQYFRHMFDPEILIERLDWGGHGRQQIEAAVDLARCRYAIDISGN